MSEANSATAQVPGTNKPAGGSPIRLVVRVILFGILLYLICALPYDYFVARPGQVKAWEKLYNERAEPGHPKFDENEKPGLLQLKNVGSGDVETTNDTVAEALGRQPSKSTSESGVLTEVYSWRAGLPWKTYNIYVVYAERKQKKPRLENAFLNEAPADLSVPDEGMRGDASTSTVPEPGTSVGVPGGRLPSPPPIGPPPDAGKPDDQNPKRPASEDEPEKPKDDKDGTKTPEKPAEKSDGSTP